MFPGCFISVDAIKSIQPYGGQEVLKLFHFALFKFFAVLEDVTETAGLTGKDAVSYQALSGVVCLRSAEKLETHLGVRGCQTWSN